MWWLAPIALALHIFTLKRCERPFLNSFIFALVFNAIALHWTSTFVGAVPWTILAIGQAVLFMPLGFANKYGVALYPFIFLLLEQLRGSFPFGGFGWMRIAYSQADAPYSSIAAIGGAVGLSALVLCISLTLFALLNARLDVFPLLPLILLLIPIHTNSIGTVKVLMVQGDVPALGLDFNSRAKAVFINHVNETEKALAKDSNVDFILWPENAVDIDINTTPGIASQVSDLSKFLQTPILIGGVTRSLNGLQNQSILFNPDKQQVYTKAPSGGPLVQHALPAMLKAVRQGKISIEKIVEKMCHNPAKIFKIEKRGYLRTGYFADIALLDRNTNTTVEKENILYKCGWSPFEGTKFTSNINSTFINGKRVYHKGEFNNTTTGMRLTFNR